MKQQLELNEAYEVITPADPDVEVLTISALQAQCRIDSVDEAELVREKLESAIDTVEADTLLVLRPTTLGLKLDRFPCGARPIELNRVPVAGNVVISYFDSDGDEQTLDEEDFIVDQASKPARVFPATGTSWPTVQSRPHAVTVRFDCGYAAGSVPPKVLEAIRLLTGHWYENREAVSVGVVTSEIQLAYSYLIQKLAWKA